MYKLTWSTKRGLSSSQTKFATVFLKSQIRPTFYAAIYE